MTYLRDLALDSVGLLLYFLHIVTTPIPTRTDRLPCSVTDLSGLG
jgi:hypothetical protein